MFAQEIVQLVVGLTCGPGWISALTIRLHRLLAEDLARQADAGAEILPVVGVRHVVEADHRRILGAPDRNVTAPREA
jgi:hypothetical protein